MPKFYERLRSLRESHDMSQMDLAKRLGISKSSVNMYERGEREPGLETLEAIADCFNVDMDYLLGKSDFRNKHAWLGSFRGETLAEFGKNVFPIPAFVKRPRLGTIACGRPILAVEDAEEFDDVPEGIECDFTLICKGDSMINARIFDGDIVYIRQQDMVDNGEIAAVLIDDEATLKRIHFFEDHIILAPENPTHKPFTYWGEEMNHIRILGKAVAFTSKVF